MSKRTAPEDRVSFPHKIIYGIGGFTNNLLGQGIGNMMAVLTLALGVDFRAVGLLGGLPRFFDALTDPLVGFVSDKTKSRWGRRRPFLFAGAISAGVIFLLLWQMPAPTQLRLKLVDHGADGVYSGETDEPVGWLRAAGDALREIFTVEVVDDVEDEVAVLPPTLVTGAWVSVDVPLSDFDGLATREHLAQMVISGDLTEVYVDNVYFYRLGGAAVGALPASASPNQGVEGVGPAAAGLQTAVPPAQDIEGATVPVTGAPAPGVPPEDVISLFSAAYDDVPVGSWSAGPDVAEVADARAGGDEVKHYTNLRVATIDFGSNPVDASAMTHLHIDIWTPDETGEGWSQRAYFWYFLIGSLVFFLAYTIFATPWVALGYELTPDYNERTRLMGVQNFVSNTVFVIGPWFLVIATNPVWFRNQMDGARFVALAICVATIVLGVLPAIFLRERVIGGSAAAEAGRDRRGSRAGGADQRAGGRGPGRRRADGRTEGGASGSRGTDERTIAHGIEQSALEFLRGLWQTLRTGPFLMLCIATFLMFNSFIMISQFQFWVFAFYITGGNVPEGAALAGVVGTLGTVTGFLVIALVTWLGTRIGKKNAFFVSTGISMLGYALKWFCYTPDQPLLALLPAPFLAFGLGGLFTLMGSMIADVVDLDEITTGERREGMFGSVFWWMVKLGQSGAIVLGGFLLYSTGLDASLGANQPEGTIFWLRFYDAFVPLIASGIAIYAVYRYPITEESAGKVRAELERRRGRGKTLR